MQLLKAIAIVIILPFISGKLFADEPQHSAQQYLKKYLHYSYWVQHLPLTPDPEFIRFIEPTSPLTQKLRNKWLYQLAAHQQWALFHQYYQPSSDIGLRCYAQTALYHLGQQQEAVRGTLPIWLSAQSQPPACTLLFALLLKDHALSQQHLDQRIALALAQNQNSMASYLLSKSGPARATQAQLLNQITQNPKRILQLQPGVLSGDLYVYGLKLLVARNMNTAITLWHHPHTQTLLTTDQKQTFLAHLALYQAMRNQDNAETWFAQVQPAYRNPSLRDWEIRYALLHHHWKTVVTLTADAEACKELIWQYWHARALDKLGRHAEAKQQFSQLASKRSYYGFLASMQLHQPLQFESEATNMDMRTLQIYKPVTDDIAALYHHHQDWLASRALNDFSSELSTSEKSALTYWVAQHLQWPGKAVYLSTQDDKLVHQLTLRFPLTHHATIQQVARQYDLSEAMIYAMIRQESMFFNDIKSSAGAYGLMQVLPRTAKLIAQRAHIHFHDAKELFISEKNIHIGVAYLKMLSQQFHGHPILMAAAYNAGPKQAHHWRQHHPPKDIDIWIETLPWQETRNYLKNVVAFYAVYQYRMHQTPNVQGFLQPF